MSSLAAEHRKRLKVLKQGSKKATKKILDDELPSRSNEGLLELDEADATEIDALKQAAFDNDEKPLVSFPGRTADGEVKTVGWLGGRGARYINIYGSKSAPRYRIEDYCYPPKYDDEKHTTYQKQNISYRENRYGESMENGKYKYTGRNMLGIFGVAWTPNSPNELETIDPQRKKESDAKWNTTYVLVKWDIDGKEIKSWETRTCIRRLWKRKEIADQAIYDAALEAENRYRIENGLGRFSSRSPSVGLIHDTVEQRRAESLNPVSTAQERVEAPSQTANPTPENASIARLLAMPPASGTMQEAAKLRTPAGHGALVIRGETMRRLTPLFAARGP
ncbi:uncharacterized protein PpBr36_11352 [Pyricularia pennisetigena]|uniref:uncharacterized protein n=1 Tax=Pyricularia pennisetigena TaxID=1578925 RepID=UPI00114F5FBA|nr:uncharacterized protein PpBr36_11352 [Pyricularia pennisetigena]TLS20474.1 hypothetical protein PpBr36_11352 [Pyricularia pennisetigena]